MRANLAAQPVLIALAGVGVVVLIVGLYLRRQGRYQGRSLSPRAAWSLGLSSVLSMLLAAWWFGLREYVPPIPRIDPAIARLYTKMSTLSVPGSVLDEGVGDKLPSFTPEGWLNGDPDGDEALGKVTVVDIWNEL